MGFKDVSMSVTNLIFSQNETPKGFSILAQDDSNFIAYVPYLDVNTWRLHLYYLLENEKGVALLERTLNDLDSKPPRDLTPPNAANLSGTKIRYHHDLDPKTMLQQSFCQVPSDFYSSNLLDPFSLSCLKELFDGIQNKAKNPEFLRNPNLFMEPSFYASNTSEDPTDFMSYLERGETELQSYLRKLGEPKLELSALRCLEAHFPRHPVYLMFLSPSKRDEFYDENSTSLNFGEIVRSYYTGLDLFRPTLSYAFPCFNDYSSKVFGTCHLALRRAGKLHSVLWGKIINDTLQARLIFKLMGGSVLEQIITKAKAYAFLRKLPKVATFINITCFGRCLDRYLELGFFPCFSYDHQFSF